MQQSRDKQNGRDRAGLVDDIDDFTGPRIERQFNPGYNVIIS